MRRVLIAIISLNLFSGGLLFSLESHSQHGQDIHVYNKFFKNKADGVFVDIGAHDGVSFSNTLLFEKLGWRGICIEPIPEIYDRLVQNRSCVTVKGCISDKEGEGDFYRIKGYSEMLSGLFESYHPDHLKRIEREIRERGGEGELIKVKLYLLNKLLEEHDMTEVDYLSIDTEGGELEILRSIDFSKVNIKVIDVEDNYPDSGLNRFLRSKGYRRVITLDCDKIYLKVRD